MLRAISCIPLLYESPSNNYHIKQIVRRHVRIPSNVEATFQNLEFNVHQAAHLEFGTRRVAEWGLKEKLLAFYYEESTNPSKIRFHRPKIRYAISIVCGSHKAEPRWTPESGRWLINFIAWALKYKFYSRKSSLSTYSLYLDLIGNCSLHSVTWDFGGGSCPTSESRRGAGVSISTVNTSSHGLLIFNQEIDARRSIV